MKRSKEQHLHVERAYSTSKNTKWRIFWWLGPQQLGIPVTNMAYVCCTNSQTYLRNRPKQHFWCWSLSSEILKWRRSRCLSLQIITKCMCSILVSMHMLKSIHNELFVVRATPLQDFNNTCISQSKHHRNRQNLQPTTIHWKTIISTQPL